MKRLHLALLLVGAFSLLVAGVIFASPASPSPAPDTTAVQTTGSPAVTLPFTTDQVFTAAGGNHGKPGQSSTLSGGGLQDLAAGCEWFDISCSNGTTDTCCGSVSSCGSYCAEVCGEPCIYVE